MRRLFIFAAAFCLLCLAGTARAAGLGEFDDRKSYDSSVFSDVSGGDWFVSGVKTAYEKGIMEGVGGGGFHPGGTVSRAEVVTIAARMFARYHGQEIPAQVGGVWYEQYTSYAEQAGLLPIGQESGWTEPADRGYIAYVFSKVVDTKDLPEVNLKVAIPDLEQIPTVYRAAAVLLYKGGVLTGKPGGYFDSPAPATRAEIATVAMRLIEPPERVSSDPKLEEQYVAQQMNAMNGAPFCVIKDGYATVAPLPSGYPIIRYVQGKSEGTIYCDGTVEQIAWFDGSLWALTTDWVEDEKSIYLFKIDMNTKEKEKTLLFRSQRNSSHISVEKLLYYDGVMYFLADEFFIDISLRGDTHLYQLTEQGEMVKKCTVKGDYARTMSAFDGKIVFSTIGEIHIYDLKADKLETVFYDVNTFVMSGNTMLIGDYSGNLIAAAVTAPELPKVLTNIDTKVYEYIDSINRYNGVLYMTDHKGWLSRYTDDGAFTRFLYMDIHGYRFGILDGRFYVTDESFLASGYIFSGQVGTMEPPHVFQSYFEWCYDGVLPSNAAMISQAEAKVALYGSVKLSVRQSFSVPVTWKSSDTAVATVDRNGEVTGRGVGTAVITAYLPDVGQTLRCTVTVIGEDAGGEAEPLQRLNAQQIYAKCAPAVFCIEVRAGGETIGVGSGFFLDAAGTAVTNYHVVENADTLLAHLPGGGVAWIRVIATDPARDIAILSIYREGQDTPYLAPGDDTALKGGQEVYAIGSPYGLDNTISNGLISHPRRELDNGHHWIQISVPMSPGSSGGALINEYGQVIGITCAGISEGQNLNFAIPISEALALLP